VDALSDAYQVGRFQGFANGPDRYFVEVQLVAVAGLKRVDVKVLVGDLGEDRIKIGHFVSPSGGRR